MFEESVREPVREVVRQGKRQPLRPVIIGRTLGAAPIIPRRREKTGLEAGVLVAAAQRLRSGIRELERGARDAPSERELHGMVGGVGVIQTVHRDVGKARIPPHQATSANRNQRVDVPIGEQMSSLGSDVAGFYDGVRWKLPLNGGVPLPGVVGLAVGIDSGVGEYLFAG